MFIDKIVCYQYDESILCYVIKPRGSAHYCIIVWLDKNTFALLIIWLIKKSWIMNSYK